MARQRTVLSVFGLHARRIGGIEVFCRELSRQLGEHGWKSVLVFLSDPSELVRQFLDLPNVQLEVLKDSWKVGWRPTLELGRLLRKYRPAVFHSQFTSFVGPYPWIAQVLLVDRIFFTDHGSRPPDDALRVAPLHKRMLVRRINYPLSRVFCVSRFVCRCLTERDLLAKERFQVLYNGVDLARAARGKGEGMAFRQRYRIPADRVIVSQVGQLIPEKGIDDFLQAGKLAVSKNANLHFVLAGDGSSRDRYVQLSERLGLADHVTFTGLVEDPMGDGLFDASDIVCQVSRWQEAFGLTIAEAMSAGKPVIGTRVGGIPELICDGQSGYLVDRGNLSDLADRILSLAEDSDLGIAMGEKGRHRCEEKFDVTDQVRSLIAYYGIN